MPVPVEFSLKTVGKTDVVEITSRVESRLGEVESTGGVNLWVPHTTAAVVVNEAADPDVLADFVEYISKAVPREASYSHLEGNSAAHIKSILTGNSQWLPVVNGKLQLGRWQGLFLLEWDGPRTRKIQLYPG